MAPIRMSAALAVFTIVLAFSSFPQGDAKFARSLKLNRTIPAVTLLPGGFAPLNESEYENPQVQQIVNFTLDAIALKTASKTARSTWALELFNANDTALSWVEVVGQSNHTGFNHTGHDLRFHILSIKTQVVAGINYVLRLTVAARHFKRAYEAEVFKAVDGNVTLTYLHPMKSGPAHNGTSHNVTETGHAHNVTTSYSHNVSETGHSQNRTHVPMMTVPVMTLPLNKPNASQP